MKTMRIMKTILLCVTFFGIYLAMGTIERLEQRAETEPLTQQETKLALWFIDHNSPDPATLSRAVCRSKKPHVMAAIAVVESGGDPKAVGDGGKSRGAFQVQAEHWGEVPIDADGQAVQAERVLEGLLARGGLRRSSLKTGLARYNGGGNPPSAAWRYADRVLKLSRSAKMAMSKKGTIAG